MREMVQQRLRHQELHKKVQPEHENTNKIDHISEVQSSIKWFNCDGEAKAQSQKMEIKESVCW